MTAGLQDITMAALMAGRNKSAAYGASEKVNGQFGQILADKAQETGASKTDAYVEYLKSRYGANVTVRDVGKDQKSMDALGASTSGYNNVVIAPNILEKMANDPEKATYYESRIQQALDAFPRCQAQLSAMGHEIHSYGVVVHPDGTMHIYVCGDLKPEVRAKIEARMKAEQAAKAARRQQYRELGEEAAKRRRQMAESTMREQMAENTLYLCQNSGREIYYVSHI